MNLLKFSTFCTGIGSPECAVEELSIEMNFKLENVFACEINKYARASYLANNSPGLMLEDMTKYSYDGDEYNSDINVAGLPCQSFSLAGLRKGENDSRGLLFYDYYRYVKKQKPKAFIIENVKGLLSDASGKTFSNWLHLLGQSVNGNHQMFNSPDSLPYNLHWTVLNTKDFGIPQNRERVFLVGIRDDLPNSFRFPIGEPLKLRLKDILEPVVDEKYYLSDKALEYLTRDSTGKWSDRLSMLNYDTADTADTAGCVTANHSKGVPYNMLQETGERAAGYRENENTISGYRGDKRRSGMQEEVYHKEDGILNTLTTGHEPKIIIKEATKQGYAIANEGDSINLSNPNSETRRGRVGVGVANTLDTACNQAVVVPEFIIGGLQANQHPRHDGISPTLTSAMGMGGGQTPIHNYGHRIRRLTPLECWRLQGFPDEQFYKAQKVNSDSQLYKQAGNSMTTTVIKAVIKNILTCILS